MTNPSKNYRIMIVEDNIGDIHLIREYLSAPFNKPCICTATSFSEAKQVIKSQSKPFDIILLDLSLPDMSGEQLVQSMLDIAGRAPIIVLTGYVDTAFAVRSLSMGVSDYLVKDDLGDLILYKSIIYSIERHKNLRRLKESEELYSDLFHLSPLPMWVYDLKTFQFLDVNEATTSHYGYSYNEFKSMTMKDLIPPEVLQKTDHNPGRAHLKPVYINRGIYKHRKKDGDTILVDIRSRVIQFGNKPAKLVIAADITERFRYLEAIELQNRKLKEIAWKQSHIVRAPLSRLMALVYLLNEEENNGKDFQFMLQQVVHAAKELDTVINDIVGQSEEIIPGNFCIEKFSNMLTDD